jgi:coenzyme F420 hydrogenase subunit beta
MTLSVEHIVAAGLCIGCGLCRSIAGPDRLEIAMTPEGRERPLVRTPLDAATLERINAVCPGTHVDGAVEGTQSKSAATDLIW